VPCAYGDRPGTNGGEKGLLLPQLSSLLDVSLRLLALFLLLLSVILLLFLTFPAPPSPTLTEYLECSYRGAPPSWLADQFGPPQSCQLPGSSILSERRSRERPI
jgi:hypothetical protein